MVSSVPSGVLLRLADCAARARQAASVASGASAALHERAALHVLDWLGNAAYGATRDVGLAMARWLALQASGDRATLAGHSADSSAAAAYHGALGSVLEMDDVHRASVLHPGPVVVPAAWAACSASSEPRLLLGAVIAGYEVMVRVGRALGPTHYKLWHPTSTAGSFGAAAAAAAMLGLDQARTAQALALAGTRAGGLWQVRHESSYGKAWHMAGAARDGLAAAQLAAAGMTGPQGVLDGPSGWFAATAPDADAALLDAPRATPWIDDVSFKPWPACRHAHPAMDALGEVLAASPVAMADIARIDVFSYADALRFCDRVAPHDEAQARFSIQHALAAWLRWGEPALAHYDGDALRDVAVSELRPRVFVHEDAAFQRRFPAQYGARVVLTLNSGALLEAELHDTRGDPARPMALAAIQAKARALMAAAAWPTARIDAAVAACAALPYSADLSDLHAVMLGRRSPAP